MPYAEVNGTQLWYEDSGTGPAVVFLHAGLMDARMWAPQLPAFSADHRAIAFDLRGYGRSDPSERSYSPTDDLLALLDTLEIDSAALVGCSMGGAIAIDFTLEHPERVQALVPVASGLGGFSFRAYSDEQIARAEASEAKGDLAASVELWLEVWAPLGSDGPIGEIARHNAQVFELGDFELELDPPAAGRLDEIRAPTLVVVGDRDVAGILEIAGLLETEIRGADKVVMHGLDHLPSLRAPDEFNRLALG
ncbi:MAG: alpha/beta hydrolase, partial [Actinobacteria bacterium]|nr:alpha/beta hydrolase [Actinomycetota bacterium]